MTRTFITKSRSGHYAATIKELRSNGEREYWVTVLKAPKLSSVVAARAVCAEFFNS